jgi:hypothetical protein
VEVVHPRQRAGTPERIAWSRGETGVDVKDEGRSEQTWFHLPHASPGGGETNATPENAGYIVITTTLSHLSSLITHKHSRQPAARAIGVGVCGGWRKRKKGIGTTCQTWQPMVGRGTAPNLEQR